MPMGMTFDIDGLTTTEAPDPPYRRITYQDEPAVVTFSKLLRFCWLIQPPDPNEPKDTTSEPSSTTYHPRDNDLPRKDVYRFLPRLSRMSAQDWTNLPWNTDKADWKSDWRRQIAFCWRHVFSDIAKFISAANPSTGRWVLRTTEEERTRYGPYMDTFAVFYSDDQSVPGEKAMVKSWSATNVIIVSIFVHVGVKVRIDRTEPGNVVAHLQTWNSSVLCREALYLRRGVEVAISVKVERGLSQDEAGRDERRNGVAAVFAYAALTPDDDNCDEISDRGDQ